MTRLRLVLAAAVAAPLLLAGVASADLRDECFEKVPSFRLKALCVHVPEGIG